ncbi:MAG: NADH-quinone oxidoreductase subunit N, partial [Sulfurimonadaceae bacterium]|nr:NADH-quinone oxidoreductase subunit N [Sulfurimonadaceae bacterium]
MSQTRFYTKGRAHFLSISVILVSLLLLQDELFRTHSVLLEQELFNGMMIFDTFSALFMVLFLIGTLMTLTIGRAFIDNAAFFKGEAFVLLLLALFGMLMLSMAYELFTALIALEIASMSVYILIGLNRSKLRPAEAFFKYLVLGSFMGSFYLLGLALIYAQTGTTHLGEISNYIALHSFEELYLVIAGGMLIMVTMMFKIAAVPFGIWVLDVYEGASLPITAFMAGTFKVAVFALALRIYLVDYLHLQEFFAPFLLLAAVITLIAGSVTAVTQSSVKRMLAASSIVHSGYLLIGLASTGAIGSSAASAILFYLVAYMFSAVGAFGILSYVGRGSGERLTYDDLKGLASHHPIVAACLSIFMLSLAGFPSTIGFLGKFYIFTGAIEAGHTALALLGALAAFVSIYYYFKVIAMLYFYPAEQEKKTYGYPLSFTVIVLSAVAVLWGGIGTGLITLIPGADIITEIAKEGIYSLSL